MGDISVHFSRWEFACSDNCGFCACDIELVEVLEDLRKYFEKSVEIASGCRCPTKNHSIPGASKLSQHMNGIAADIHVEDVSPDEVATYLERKYPNRYGIGRYDTWTHIDVRGTPGARWDKRS